ncbi:hypothetical protein ELOC111193_18780 [Elizabethkingia occulta]|uniref:DUF4294 domain-containing protein n=1 Tax=Elizabethkingia occulta TaxID=1867263 RepID=A0A1T3MGX2_9FLAO|nr:hypothetical protein [Elizabethkingia occulta]OPC63893.1 hypothetical protein BAZ10_07410 [Elizabethkingia occulta]
MRKVLLLLSVGTIGFVTTVHAQSYEQYKKQKEYEARYQQEQLQQRKNQVNAYYRQYITVATNYLNYYKISPKAPNGLVRFSYFIKKYSKTYYEEQRLWNIVYTYYYGGDSSLYTKASNLRDRIKHTEYATDYDVVDTNK